MLHICAVVGYATKMALARPVTAAQTATDLPGALQAAIGAAEALLGRPLAADCGDPVTGEIVPLAAVTDNGPAMKPVAAARWFAARAHLTHARTRRRSPHTNGVVERWTEPLKYEHLYREDIPSGVEPADHAADFIDEHNHIRPHEAPHRKRPPDAHPDDPTLKHNPPETEQNS
ncbi:MAG: integrase core domain-containing protein [bacterium]|nr:integrase core domain-containing protein [bacterium]